MAVVPVDISGLSYVALRDMKINGTTRLAGASVPEAAAFKNLHNYISAGFIAVVSGTSHPGVPASGTKAARTKVGKAEGNAEYTHYRPTDHNGTPAIVASDAL